MKAPFRRLPRTATLLASFAFCSLAMWSMLEAQSPVRAGAAAVPASKGGIRENYDVRDTESASVASLTVRSGYRAKQVTGTHAAKLDAAMGGLAPARASLASKVPTLQTEASRFNPAPEIVGTADAKAYLTGASTAPHEAILRGFLAENAAVYGLTPEQTAALTKFSDYANPAGNLSWVGLKQEINGLPVFQGELLAAFTPDGSLARTTGNLALGLDDGLPTTAALTPAQAASKAAATIGYTVDPAKLTLNSTEENGRVAYLSFGPFVKEIKTEKLYFPVEPGVATLAYSMVLWENVNAYYVIVDADDGTLLWRKNITQDQTQAATFNVYTGGSPSPYNPTTTLPGQGFQGLGVARVDVTLVADDLTASPLGWITDSISGSTTTTTGNNCDAGLDADATDGIDASSRPTSTNRTFSFSYNPAPLGTESPRTAASRSGAITNLFFWTNRYHDALYNLGFTEAARNFQTTNTFNGVSRGGVGGDAVSAQVQDTADVGANANYNNANFSTPADGTSGKMQMYLFNSPTPNRDGDLDAEVFLHEMTHGLSNRLHNNGSGLATQQAGGMGEGWSDYYARCLLSKPTEDVNAVYQSGGYVTYLLGGLTDNYYYGIRTFPYAVRSNLGANGKSHNPLTFGVIDLTQTNGLSNGAYASSPIIGIYASEVHNVGVFWCTALLEMRARIIQRLGYAVGSQRALQIVTDGMKLDGINPTIIVARDQIIAADNAGFAGADVADIRSAFAIRGVGAGASTATVSTYFFTVVESFYPSSVAGAITFSDSLGNNNGVPDPGEDLVFTIPLTNKLTVADANVTGQLGPASAAYGTIAAGATTTQTFNYHVPASAVPGTPLNVPFTVSSPNGTVIVQIPLQIGTPTVTPELAQDFNSTATGSLPTGWTQTGTVSGSAWSVNATVIDGGNCAFAADVSTTSDSSLVSPVITLNNNLNQQISFKHRYTTQTSQGIGYDGGVLEISIAGGTFTDIVTAGGSWAQGGYAEQITSSSTNNPLIGRRAWSGIVTTTATVVANLPTSAVGRSVQFRWRLGCGASTSSTGWYIDTVQVYSTTYASTTIDADGDGIPDGYERLYGLNPNDPTDGAGDLDGDGVSNRDEYLAGTDPTSAASRPGVSVTAYSPTGGLTLSFPTVIGHTYQLEFKSALSDPAWTLLPGTYDGTGGPVSILYLPTDLNNQPARFYRLRVSFSQP